MNLNDSQFELIRRCHDGEASSDELAQLEGNLRNNASFREDYVRYMNLDVALSAAVAPMASVSEGDFASSKPANENVVLRSRLFPGRWLAATAAGVMLGIVCTTVVFAYVAPHIRKVIPLLQDGFESGPPPLVKGVPLESGCWSGDYSEVVGKQQEVLPESGTKMLRVLRADYEGKSNADGSYCGDIFRLIDLRPYRTEFGDGGAVVQLSAAFNASDFPLDEKYQCTISLHALDADAAMNGSTRTGHPLYADSLAMARNSRLRMDRNPATWQRLTAELRLPPNTEFLLIHLGVIHATPSQRRASFEGHFLDNVRITLENRPPLP